MQQDEQTVRAYVGRRSYAVHLARAKKTGLMDHVQELSDAEAVALIWYTSKKSALFLKRMRSGASRRDDQAFSLILSSACAKLPPFEGAIVYRVIKLTDHEFAPFVAKYRAGDVVQWSTFSSCSTSDRTRFNGNVLFAIQHKTGRTIGNYSWHPGENEVLLPPGRSFRVESLVVPEQGRLEVEIAEM